MGEILTEEVRRQTSLSAGASEAQTIIEDVESASRVMFFWFLVDRVDVCLLLSDIILHQYVLLIECYVFGLRRRGIQVVRHQHDLWSGVCCEGPGNEIVIVKIHEK